MKCYKVNVKSLSVSNRKDKENDSICLYEGDFIFLSSDSYYVLNTENKYSQLMMLKKIYYNRVFNILGDSEWTTIDNINILDPIIEYNGRYRLSNSINLLLEKEILSDYTIEWNRQEKIDNLIQNDMG